MLPTVTLVLAAVLASAPASPSPAPSPPADTCASANGHTAVLSVINRPTVGFSPCAVKPDESLLEIGYQAGAGDIAQNQTGQGFLRFGVVPNIEVDLIGPAYAVQRVPMEAHGFFDFGAGMKWEFAHTSSSAFGMDVLLTVPSGAPAFSAGAATQTVNVNDSFSFGNFGVSTTFGVSHQNGYRTLFPSIAVTNQFNNRTQWYAEAFAQTKSSPDGKALVGLDGGLQYLMTPQLEFDVEGGRTISDTARTRYFGFGFGVRL